MWYLRRLFLSFIAVASVSIALANLKLTELSLLPSGLADSLEFQVQFEAPLFIIIFLCIAVGLSIGFFWEWGRSTKKRLSSTPNRRKLARLSQEITELKSIDDEDEDEEDVLLLTKRYLETK